MSAENQSKQHGRSPGGKVSKVSTGHGGKASHSFPVISCRLRKGRPLTGAGFPFFLRPPDHGNTLSRAELRTGLAISPGLFVDFVRLASVVRWMRDAKF